MFYVLILGCLLLLFREPIVASGQGLQTKTSLFANSGIYRFFNKHEIKNQTSKNQKYTDKTEFDQRNSKVGVLVAKACSSESMLLKDNLAVQRLKPLDLPVTGQ